jgi:DNA-binding XRE family transcriptional regulator
MLATSVIFQKNCSQQTVQQTKNGKYIPKWENTYQITTNLPKDHKIHQLRIKYVFQYFPIQGPPKYTQSRDF